MLEGGSVISDGAGTIVTTEQCLLHPNRNPSLSRDAIEELLAEYLGAERVVWLGQGLVEDRDTDGHVDLIAAFTPGGRALMQTVPASNPNHANCAENLERLQRGRDRDDRDPAPAVRRGGRRAGGGRLPEPLHLQRRRDRAGDRDEFDEEALAIIADAFPGARVVPVPGATIAYGGGGPHCITQQVPAS